jgi:hypothetical protein
VPKTLIFFYATERPEKANFEQVQIQHPDGWTFLVLFYNPNGGQATQ